MSKQEDSAIWWPERGYFTATPEQLERLITSGAKQEQERIIKLLEDRKALLKDPNNQYITAMNIAVTKESAMAVTDATIWLIKGEK